MIKTETIVINDSEYVRTWSDQDKMIEREGALYEEAIDPIGYDRVYTETDQDIEHVFLSEIEEKAAAYDIMTGVSN